jgi:phosphoglycerate kinase
MSLLSDLRTAEELELENQRVFVRLDLDLNVDGATGTIADSQRIQTALATLKYLAQGGARIIIGSHRGQPKGKPQAELSMEPVGMKLAELTQWDILLPDDCVGDAARKAIADLRPGQAVLLENLRFNAGEETNDEAFARELSSMADVYVNDALAASNREHASLHALPRLMQNRGIGHAVKAELAALDRVLEPELPLVAILGGMRLTERFELIASLLKPDRTLFFGGTLACIFHSSLGIGVGTTRVDPQEQARARTLLEQASLKGAKIVLPEDFVVVQRTEGTPTRVVRHDAIDANEDVVDIGPSSLQRIRSALSPARTILWVGAMGWAGHPVFSAGTVNVAKFMAEVSAYGVVIGAAAVAALRQAGESVAEHIGCVSAGGGAALELLEGRKLPGLEVMRRG